MKCISILLLVFAIFLRETTSSRLRSEHRLQPTEEKDAQHIPNARIVCTYRNVHGAYLEVCVSVRVRWWRKKKTLYFGAPLPSDWKCKELEESDTRSKMIKRAIDDSTGSLDKRAFDPFTGLNPLVKSLGWGSRQ